MFDLFRGAKNPQATDHDLTQKLIRYKADVQERKVLVAKLF
jgi:hypothetical protein